MSSQELAIVVPTEYQGLVFSDGEGAKTDSLRIAERFGKIHRDVVRAIENILDVDMRNFAHISDKIAYEEFVSKNFTQKEYTDSQGRTRKFYEITEKGHHFVVMGFTGAEATIWKIRFIEAFSWMQGALREVYKSQIKERINKNANDYVEERLEKQNELICRATKPDMDRAARLLAENQYLKSHLESCTCSAMRKFKKHWLKNHDDNLEWWSEGVEVRDRYKDFYDKPEL